MVDFARERFLAALQFQRETVEKHNFHGSETSKPFVFSTEENLYIFDSLPSTNQTLWDLIDNGAPAGTTVIATQQTAGKGQWGRNWISEAGGLYLSMAIAPHLPISHPAELTMSVAWGIAVALGDRQIPVLLKWPNDLILQNRKLGGILTETRVKEGQIAKAVVGVGLNWANPVPETGINLQTFFANRQRPPISMPSATTLAPLGRQISQPSATTPARGLPRLGRETLSLEMLGAIAVWGTELGIRRLKEEGIDNLLPSYCQLLTSIGRQILINGASGKIVGVTTSGELRVELRRDINAPTTEYPTSIKEIYLKPGTISLGYS